ncbi:hypothetical protein ACI2KS_13935 [Pseudomonas sp. NPDC087358]|uniref:hypothetical protein n=1 Tax=Pseudomonas sp. NPDC087358 TaxID=3364439 RepID=UPI00384B2817
MDTHSPHLVVPDITPAHKLPQNYPATSLTGSLFSFAATDSKLFPIETLIFVHGLITVWAELFCAAVAHTPAHRRPAGDLIFSRAMGRLIFCAVVHPDSAAMLMVAITANPGFFMCCSMRRLSVRATGLSASLKSSVEVSPTFRSDSPIVTS